VHDGSRLSDGLDKTYRSPKNIGQLEFRASNFRFWSFRVLPVANGEILIGRPPWLQVQCWSIVAYVSAVNNTTDTFLMPLVKRFPPTQRAVLAI